MESNAIHAFVSHQLTPVQLAEFMSKVNLNLRDQTKQSVVHYQRVQPTEPSPVDE